MVEFKNVANSLLQGPRDETTAPSPTLLAELESLGREQDAEIFYGDLLRLGRRFQNRDQLDWALKLYAAVAAQTEFPELSEKAGEAIAALEGRGAIGARAEILISRFVKDASDPAMILPMLAGTTVAGLVRAAGLGALAAGPAAWYSRGLGARLSAGSLAFAAEVPTFVATGRVLRGLEVQNPWSRDLQSAALSLGAIKLFGLAGKQGLAQLHGVNEWGALTRGAAFARYSHPLVHQSALFGGLLTAHWAETRLGLRPQVDDATAVTDTLASMISLGAGMRLGTGLLGRGYARQMRELEWRSRTLPRALDLSLLQTLKVPAKALGGAAGLGILLRSPAAWAGTEGLRMSMAGLDPFMLLEILLLAGGPLAWGLIEFMDARKLKNGPDYGPELKREAQVLKNLTAKAPTLPPAALKNGAEYASHCLAKGRFWGKEIDKIQTSLAAIEFLEAAIPRIEPPSARVRFLKDLVHVVQSGKKGAEPRALQAFRQVLPSIPPADRRGLIQQIAPYLNSAFSENTLSGYFMIVEAAAPLDSARRIAEARSLLFNLSRNKRVIDQIALQLRTKQRQLQEFAAGAGKPAEPRFDLRTAIAHASLLRILLGEAPLPAPPQNAKPEALAKYFQQPALREYLEAGPDYFDQFSEARLRQRVIQRLVPQSYRSPNLSED
ncbi:MAG TPA: hypothetical protein VJR29_03400 [bacterium]|nr:hypothetical protein [bacterium]